VKGHVQRRGKTYRYFFDGDADPLTGKRRQVTKGGFATECAAWAGNCGNPADHTVTTPHPVTDATVTPLSRGVTAATAATETTNPTTGGPRP
jgi:hypothetical protein